MFKLSIKCTASSEVVRKVILSYPNQTILDIYLNERKCDCIGKPIAKGSTESFNEGRSTDSDSSHSHPVFYELQGSYLATQVKGMGITRQSYVFSHVDCSVP